MKIREFILEKVSLYVMRTFFNGYLFPFEAVEEKFQKLNEEQKVGYALDAKQITESRVFREEMEGATRKIYQELAVKSTSTESVIAYRMTLKFIQDFYARLQMVASYSQSLKNNNVSKSIR